jgi:hypothetical protein
MRAKVSSKIKTAAGKVNEKLPDKVKHKLAPNEFIVPVAAGGAVVGVFSCPHDVVQMRLFVLP